MAHTVYKHYKQSGDPTFHTFEHLDWLNTNPKLYVPHICPYNSTNISTKIVLYFTGIHNGWKHYIWWVESRGGGKWWKKVNLQEHSCLCRRALWGNNRDFDVADDMMAGFSCSENKHTVKVQQLTLMDVCKKWTTLHFLCNILMYIIFDTWYSMNSVIQFQLLCKFSFP